MNQDDSFLIRGARAIATGLPGAQGCALGHDLRVVAGRIAAIGDLPPLPGERIHEARDCVLYPAWINTHHHLFQSLLKAVPAGLDASLTPWLSAVPYAWRARFDADTFRIAVRIGLVELLLSGCATVADHNYLYHPGQGWDPSAILFEEAEALGMRMVLCRGGATMMRDTETHLPQALQPESFDAYLSDVQRLVSRYHQGADDAMRRVVLAPTTPNFSMTPTQMRECAQEARRLGIRMHSHLSETVNYQDAIARQHGCKPVEFVESLGWLGPDVWYAHLVKLDADEIALLGRTRTGIAHCPQSNARLGSGIAPVRELAKAGAPVSLGVDGAASNEAADMLSEVHAAWQFQRLAQGQAALAETRGGGGEPGLDLLPASEVLHWGTAGGATVLGMPRIGTLEVGQLADLALYDLGTDPRYFGQHEVLHAPVRSGGRADLRGLWVQGRQRVAQGRCLGLDLVQLQRQAAAAIAQLQGA